MTGNLVGREFKAGTKPRRLATGRAGSSPQYHCGPASQNSGGTIQKPAESTISTNG